MKNIIPFFICIAAIHSFHFANGQQVDQPYEVGTWKGFSEAAISYTWDDNTSNQLPVAEPLYNEFGFKVTFFTSMAFNPDWNGLRQASQNGHEIASHALNTKSLSGLSDSAQKAELGDSKAKINQEIQNDSCVTFAYPNCDVGKRSLTSDYYIGARGCNGQIEAATPNDFMNTGAIICGSQGSVSTTSDFNSTANTAANSNGWAIFLLHGIDGDGGYSPVQSSELRPHLEYVDQNPDQFWVDTYGDVIRYIKERNSASVTELSSKDSTVTVSVTDTLNNKVYNHPLTIQRPLPSGWENAIATQAGDTVQTTVATENSTDFIRFNAVPDNGDVKLMAAEKNVTGTGRIRKHQNIPSLNIYPNPAESKAQVRFTLKKQSRVTLTLQSPSGKKIEEVVNETVKAGTHTYTLDLTGFNGKFYYCTLTVNGKTKTEKILSE